MKETFLDSVEVAAIDTETNLTDRFQDRRCRGVSISTDKGENVYIPVSHSSWMAPDEPQIELPKDLLNPNITWVMHNAKFDIHVLEKAGVQIPERFHFYDTMLMAHYINEEELSFGLDAMAKKYVGYDSGKNTELAKAMKGAKWDDIPGFIMAKYACQDTEATLNLYRVLKPLFASFEKCWEIDKEFLLLLRNIEKRGVRLDVEKTNYWREQCLVQLQDLKEKIGFDPQKQKVLQEKLFSSPPVGLGLRPLTKTPGGKPQVNTNFLTKTNHPTCGLLLQYRETQKQLTSYYNSYLNLVGSDYDRIHASFKQHGTVTGRISCADPNMQQIPRESPIKKLFLPDEGFELWEIDFKNIEMRLATVYSKEPALLDTFREEGDVHQLTADLLGISRQHAKIINFLIIYGGGAEALSYQLNRPINECKRILADYNSAYPRLHATRVAAMESCKDNNGCVRMWSGRVRHFRWPSEYNKAFNSIIQGGAFEIVKRSMLNLTMYDIRNQVHDSVWLNVRSHKDVDAAEHLMADWTEEVFGLKFSVESKRLS